MIPTYHCARHLARAIESVLEQAPNEDEMQIEVVDDASTADDPASVAAAFGGRVLFHRREANGGPSRAFNTCIERARGELVHILHGDDFVLPGFYAAIEQASRFHPEAGLLATRVFFCDEEGIAEGLTGRLPGMERTPSRDPTPFFRITPLQCAGVVVRRRAYERVGGFRPELVFMQDREMWCRVVASCGGVVVPDVLAAYRRGPSSVTGRTRRGAIHLEDAERCAAIMAGDYATFPRRIVADDTIEWARSEAAFFRGLGDGEAYRACHGFWSRRAGPRHRVAAFLIAAEAALRRAAKRLVRLRTDAPTAA